MKILDRYISTQYLKNFALASFGLTLVYFAQSVFSGLIDKDHTTAQWLYYCILQTPQIFVQLTPPSVLLATVLTLSQLNRNSELVAIYSIGVGIQKISWILILATILPCLFSLFLQDRVLPPIYRTRTTYYWREMKKQTDFYFDANRNKIWYRSQNLIYNLRTFDFVSSRINGMSIYQFSPNFHLEKSIEAEAAYFKDGKWELHNGLSTEYLVDSEFPNTTSFKQLVVEIPETPKDFQAIEKEVESLKLYDLYKYIAKHRSSGVDTKTFEVNFHSRIGSSFLPFVMCVLAIPFSIRNRRQGGMAKDLTFCLFLTLVYWIVYSVSLSLGQAGSLHPILAAWGPTLIFTVLTGWIVYTNRAHVKA